MLELLNTRNHTWPDSKIVILFGKIVILPDDARRSIANTAPLSGYGLRVCVAPCWSWLWSTRSAMGLLTRMGDFDFFPDSEALIDFRKWCPVKPQTLPNVSTLKVLYIYRYIYIIPYTCPYYYVWQPINYALYEWVWMAVRVLEVINN